MATKSVRTVINNSIARVLPELKKRVKEEYTFTDIDEDHKHEHWQNSTDIDKYDN